jgi:hypothetical protein
MILTYHEAVDRARKLARGNGEIAERPIVVAEAITRYGADLKARGGNRKSTPTAGTAISTSGRDELAWGQS